MDRDTDPNHDLVPLRFRPSDSNPIEVTYDKAKLCLQKGQWSGRPI